MEHIYPYPEESKPLDQRDSILSGIPCAVIKARLTEINPDTGKPRYPKNLVGGALNALRVVHYYMQLPDEYRTYSVIPRIAKDEMLPRPLFDDPIPELNRQQAAGADVLSLDSLAYIVDAVHEEIVDPRLTSEKKRDKLQALVGRRVNRGIVEIWDVILEKFPLSSTDLGEE